MNINPTWKDGGFWTASTSAKGIQELEFGKYQSNHWASPIMCLHKGLTQHWSSETKPISPDLSISILYSVNRHLMSPDSTLCPILSTGNTEMNQVVPEGVLVR